MYSDDIAIRVNNISKYFEIYDKPSHRLLQMLYRGRKRFLNRTGHCATFPLK